VKGWTDAAVENQFVEFSKGGPVIVANLRNVRLFTFTMTGMDDEISQASRYSTVTNLY
jgi:hypothetical protein